MATFTVQLWKTVLALTLLLLLAACGDSPQTQDPEGEEAQGQGAVVHVYSPNSFQAQELFAAFTSRTGIEVRVVRGGTDELVQRLMREGEASPADLLIVVDAARLHQAKVGGLFQAVRSRVLEANIPVHLRDPAGEWFGLSKRARVIAYSRERVRPEQLSGYEDLTSRRWKGKILTGSSEDLFTRSLAASLLLSGSRPDLADWASGVTANMAAIPPASDRQRILALASGAADLALVNTSALVRMLASDDAEDVTAARTAGLLFPDQEGRGTHLNVSGAGVTRHAPHPDKALRLLEFLSRAEAQQVLSASSGDYPVNEEADWNESLPHWGRFRGDPVSLAVLGLYAEEAGDVLRESGWP